MLSTPRLNLFNATKDLLEAELVGKDLLGSALKAEVPADWPPGEYDRAACEFFLARLIENPASSEWYGFYAVTNTIPFTLIGCGGYFGPPDQTLEVEIGYSICEASRGLGFATEIVGALTGYAFERGVILVRARTRPDNAASIRVLEKCGFVPAPHDEEGLLKFVHPKVG